MCQVKFRFRFFWLLGEKIHPSKLFPPVHIYNCEHHCIARRNLEHFNQDHTPLCFYFLSPFVFITPLWQQHLCPQTHTHTQLKLFDQWNWKLHSLKTICASTAEKWAHFCHRVRLSGWVQRSTESKPHKHDQLQTSPGTSTRVTFKHQMWAHVNLPVSYISHSLLRGATVNFIYLFIAHMRSVSCLAKESYCF